MAFHRAEYYSAERGLYVSMFQITNILQVSFKVIIGNKKLNVHFQRKRTPSLVHHKNKNKNKKINQQATVYGYNNQSRKQMKHLIVSKMHQLQYTTAKIVSTDSNLPGTTLGGSCFPSGAQTYRCPLYQTKWGGFGAYKLPSGKLI